ncbi:hypothetical protein [Flavihumibacter petaseus]|uniref:ADP,ATP carrier protein n=1 Tax=Flavihumibacter petaseus NBRC 106054 TaxID=1220578 RepID=A0A0E9MW10_9BACT|nr:hypothetical protein [Flavihumibacter petaseus]GAO41315.1 hypothetical protein FPE01S_01_03270 [Flavihumibacter petaseus NBRC 106054]
MRPNHRWLKLLNVHDNEWLTVKKLFWLQFFQGAGISFFFTAEFARFLERFPISRLPWVMILSAFLLWLSGLVYTVLEPLISFKKFNTALILFMAGSMLMVRLGSIVFPQDWFYYFSLAWFYVLYLLNNLEFWGIAAQLFDIRQSKRLFGVISAGDIPAKFVGYTLALVFVSFTGTLNLLLVGFLCMLASLPFFTRLADDEAAAFGHGHQHGGHSSAHPWQSVSNLIEDFKHSKIIQRIAWISLTTGACMIIVNYGFYAKVKENNHTDIELARFIAVFMITLRVAAMVTKTIFTGRLTMHLGVRQSLFITPVAMVLLVGFILVFSHGNNNPKLILYLFGATSIGVDVLRTAINAPVILTVMQPLPLHERLRAHNIVKGIMDPFATLFCGILLLVLFHYQQSINLVTLCYVLLIIAAAWIIGIVLVNAEYLNMLIKTISSRFFSQEEFNLNDAETLTKIQEKIKSGSESEVMSVLLMVATKQNPLSTDLLERFLEHPARDIRLETIRIIGSKKITSLKERLIPFVFREEEQLLQLEAVKTICQLADNAMELDAYLNHPSAIIRQTAMIGLMNNTQGIPAGQAGSIIGTMIDNGDKAEKLRALDMLEAANEVFGLDAHAGLLSDTDHQVRTRAINALGKAATPNTIKALAAIAPKEEKLAVKAFQRIGPAALPHLRQLLLKLHAGQNIRKQLLLVTGRIGGEAAQKILLEQLTAKPADAADIVKALYRSKYIVTAESRGMLEEYCRHYIKNAVELLHMQKALPEKQDPDPLLFSAVQIELQEIREVLLCLFACLYDRKQIKKVRNGLLANRKDNIANALEIIELTVKKDLGKYFNILYESVPIERKCDLLKMLNGGFRYDQAGSVLGRILSEQPIRYLDWTKACSLYITRKYTIPVEEQLLLKFLEAESLLLQETARYAYAN